jgi:hypothetical protein
MADQAFFKNTAPRTSGGGGGGGGADLEFQGLNAKHPKALYAGGGEVQYQNPEDRGGFFDYSPGYYQEVANRINPEGQGGGYNDATRHILASADMTRRFGEIPASLLGYGHEAWNYLEGKFNGRPQTNEDMQQDLHNNAVGRQIGKNATSFQDIVNQVPQALDVRPYQTESNKAMVRHPNEAKTPYKPFGAFAKGGVANMNEGGSPDFEGSYYMHPSVQRLVANGEIPAGDARWMSDYAGTKGSTTAEGKGAWKDQSEKMQNLVGRMERGEIPIPKHMQGPEGVRVGGNSSGLNPNGAGGIGGGGGRADVSRIGGNGGGGGSADIKHFMNPRNIAYQDGGNVNIDAMRLALMKG